jgi:rSAM/selenodomain-associated transferase 1
MNLAGRCAIAVMAKAPQPGRVKTRLTPMLSPQAAMRLSCAFLRDITENLAAAARQAPIDPYVAYAPAGSAALFDGLLAAGTKLVLADGSGEMPAGVEGFGRCLLHANRSLFALGYSAVCVLNSDSPTLPTRYLSDAARMLLAPGRRAVLGEAEDGGYYLLGLQHAEPAVFSDIAWSTATVGAETRQRAHAIGLAVSMLPSWYDVDDAGSLSRLRADLAAPGEGYAAPYTRDELVDIDVSIAS